MQVAKVFSCSVILLAISAAAIIGVSAVVPLEDANAVSDDHGNTSSCKNHPSDISKKCSKNNNNTPLILPFP
jgi:hypothetical protein